MNLPRVPLPPVFLARPLAHRALHDVAKGRAENSRKAIKAAIDAGYGIEIDVQLSADGAAMVFHDYDLARLAQATGAIGVQTSAALAKTALRHDGDGIPTLPEVLDIVAGQVPLLIEIKDQDGEMGPNIGKLEAATVAALASYTGPVAVMSFNPHSVAEVGRLAPHLPRGITTGAYKYENWTPLPHAVCDRPAVQAIKAAGYPVLCWAVKSPEAEVLARKVADNITFEQYLA